MSVAKVIARAFVTELRCVADRCAHIVTLESPPHSQPACPKCGGPVILKTVDSGAVAERIGSEAKGTLLTVEGAVAELRTFVTSLAERIEPKAREYFERLAREVVYVQDDVAEFLKAKLEPAASSNVEEVIHSLGGPTIVTSHAEVQDQVTVSELPPGSA